MKTPFHKGLKERPEDFPQRMLERMKKESQKAGKPSTWLGPLEELGKTRRKRTKDSIKARKERNKRRAVDKKGKELAAKRKAAGVAPKKATKATKKGSGGKEAVNTKPAAKAAAKPKPPTKGSKKKDAAKK